MEKKGRVACDNIYVSGFCNWAQLKMMGGSFGVRVC